MFELRPIAYPPIAAKPGFERAAFATVPTAFFVTAGPAILAAAASKGKKIGII
jgi:hypothetical protein